MSLCYESCVILNPYSYLYLKQSCNFKLFSKFHRATSAYNLYFKYSHNFKLFCNFHQAISYPLSIIKGISQNLTILTSSTSSTSSFHFLSQCFLFRSLFFQLPSKCFPSWVFYELSFSCSVARIFWS